MTQHFLLSAAARSLSLAKVMRMTEDQAFDAFRSIRWADTEGDAVCAKCGCFECYTFKARRIFKWRFWTCGFIRGLALLTGHQAQPPSRLSWDGGRLTFVRVFARVLGLRRNTVNLQAVGPLNGV